MKDYFRSPVSTSVAIFFGLYVLATYIFPIDRTWILNWVVIASAAALLVGAINLMNVHLTKLRETTGNSLYSFTLIAALILTFLVAFIPGDLGATATQWIFQYIQIPIESSLMAVMTITLTYAAARLLGRRANLYSVLFVVFLLISLVINGGFINLEFGLLKTIAGAGARGILIGIGLGTVTTGIRILIGADRPYSR